MASRSKNRPEYGSWQTDAAVDLCKRLAAEWRETKDQPRRQGLLTYLLNEVEWIVLGKVEQ